MSELSKTFDRHQAAIAKAVADTSRAAETLGGAIPPTALPPTMALAHALDAERAAYSACMVWLVDLLLGDDKNASGHPASATADAKPTGSGN